MLGQKALAWVGDDMQNEVSQILINGHWQEAGTQGASATFHPPTKCFNNSAHVKLHIRPIEGSDVQIQTLLPRGQHCKGASNKFKLISIETCPEEGEAHFKSDAE